MAMQVRQRALFAGMSVQTMIQMGEWRERLISLLRDGQFESQLFLLAQFWHLLSWFRRMWPFNMTVSYFSALTVVAIFQFATSCVCGTGFLHL